ncbi:MAG: hypothetical protein JWM68_5828 [Verrucomicrobiales bacterium]|nr:hypothetical protein [Verrucomicrobiales bacterium]
MICKPLLGFAVAFFVFLSTLRSEPLNVVVGDLTFKRPAAWVFEPPKGNSSSVSRFVISLENEKPAGDVRFYLPGKTPAEARKLWKSYAAPEDVGTFRVEEKKIGKQTITYISLHGKLKVPGEKQSNQVGFIGAVIPIGENFMHVRMAGSADLVEKSTATFKRMVEEAVQDREAERN